MSRVQLVKLLQNDSIPSQSSAISIFQIIVPWGSHLISNRQRVLLSFSKISVNNRSPISVGYWKQFSGSNLKFDTVLRINEYVAAKFSVRLKRYYKKLQKLLKVHYLAALVLYSWYCNLNVASHKHNVI